MRSRCELPKTENSRQNSSKKALVLVSFGEEKWTSRLLALLLFLVLYLQMRFVSVDRFAFHWSVSSSS
jgi:hypothetical protein